jgi:predicted DNA-binding ribbon-helix-helix protein
MSVANLQNYRPVTIGDMRNRGCQELLVRCNSGDCGHRATVAATQWSDDTAIGSLGPFFECSRCGNVGADVCPNWSPGTGSPDGLAEKSGKEGAVRSGLVPKRTVTIAGRKTGVTLEDEFWSALREIAGQRHMAVSDLVSAINAERQRRNLSAAIRVFVLDFYRDRG